MFRQRYEKLNESVKPNLELINKVKSYSKVNKKNNFNLIILKPIIVMITLIITYCSVPVLATNIPIIYDLMYQVSPSVAQHFMPIQKTCVSNDIEMEVVSANIKDDVAQIYITLKDLTGNRVDETTDLNDSYDINRSFYCVIGNCENIGYDEKTKKATFLITITNNENKSISGKKITFSMNNFISQKKEWKNLQLPISSEQIENRTEKEKINWSGFSTINEKYEYMSNERESTVIKPNKNIEFVTNMKITGIAYCEEKLHIQVCAKDNLKLDNHGEIYLKNNQTNEIKKSAYNVHFIMGEEDNRYIVSSDYYRTNNPNRRDFTEYVFDIKKEELKDYDFYGDFVTGGINTEGNWRITFPLELK